MKKLNLLCSLLLGSGILALSACGRSGESSSSDNLESEPSLIDDASTTSVDESSGSESSNDETSSEDPLPDSQPISSSSDEAEATVYGTWVGDLTGYDYEGEPNYDDLSDVCIVINEDLSGSYRGTSVTWTLMGEGTLLAGRYRYYNDDYQVHFGYDEDTDTIDVKWEDMMEGNYRTGTFERQ